MGVRGGCEQTGRLACMAWSREVFARRPMLHSRARLCGMEVPVELKPIKLSFLLPSRIGIAIYFYASIFLFSRSVSFTNINEEVNRHKKRDKSIN